MRQLLEDNAELRFPEGKPAYYAGWRPPEVITPEMSAQASELAHSVRASLSAPPVDREVGIVLLTRMAAHFWTDNDPARWEILLNDYADDLADVPGPLLIEALIAWRRTGTRYPKVAELLGLIEQAKAKHELDARRLETIAAAIANSGNAG